MKFQWVKQSVKTINIQRLVYLFLIPWGSFFLLCGVWIISRASLKTLRRTQFKRA